jgi:hypothetical protein
MHHCLSPRQRSTRAFPYSWLSNANLLLHWFHSSPLWTMRSSSPLELYVARMYLRLLLGQTVKRQFSVTHGAMTRTCVICLLIIVFLCFTPSTAIDVVKTRIQVDPALKGHSLLSGGRLITANEGSRALLTGFGPTAVGYLIQGGAKFAGYEFWKKQFVQIAGDQETATKYRTVIYLGASSVAE